MSCRDNGKLTAGYPVDAGTAAVSEARSLALSVSGISGRPWPGARRHRYGNSPPHAGRGRDGWLASVRRTHGRFRRRQPALPADRIHSPSHRRGSAETHEKQRHSAQRFGRPRGRASSISARRWRTAKSRAPPSMCSNSSHPFQRRFSACRMLCSRRIWGDPRSRRAARSGAKASKTSSRSSRAESRILQPFHSIDNRQHKRSTDAGQ